MAGSSTAVASESPNPGMDSMAARSARASSGCPSAIRTVAAQARFVTMKSARPVRPEASTCHSRYRAASSGRPSERERARPVRPDLHQVELVARPFGLLLEDGRRLEHPLEVSRREQRGERAGPDRQRSVLQPAGLGEPESLREHVQGRCGTLEVPYLDPEVVVDDRRHATQPCVDPELDRLAEVRQAAGVPEDASGAASVGERTHRDRQPCRRRHRQRALQQRDRLLRVPRTDQIERDVRHRVQ